MVNSAGCCRWFCVKTSSAALSFFLLEQLAAVLVQILSWQPEAGFFNHRVSLGAAAQLF